MDFEATLDAIRSRPGYFGRPATPENVADAERRLEVNFPIDYKRFLLEVGSAHWPETIYGITDELPPGYRLVEVTLDERNNVEPEMPSALIPFSPDGWGNHYCLNTANLEGDACPVVFWSHELEADQPLERLNESFAGWLVEAVRSVS